ncbi:hypothetical protein ACP90_22790 [Labrenzia sp. CP4]|jgi:hypothetical protein|nr:hypothetical protein ACP90_22790 [Labrenzia sp. CP4]
MEGLQGDCKPSVRQGAEPKTRAGWTRRLALPFRHLKRCAFFQKEFQVFIVVFLKGLFGEKETLGN